VGLIPDDLGKHPLGLSPSPEELDHLLDLRVNDSPDDHAPRTCAAYDLVYWPKGCVSVAPTEKSLAGTLETSAVEQFAKSPGRRFRSGAV
jgi:hypothetical protein